MCRRDHPVRPVWRSSVRLKGVQNDDGMVDRGRSVARSGHGHPLRCLLGNRRGDGCCGLGEALSGEALVMRTLRERDALLEESWKQFGDVPMDPSTETMEAPFLDFPAGPAALTFGAGLMNGIARALPTCFTTRMPLTRQASRACCTARSSALNAALKPACSTRRASAWPRS